MIWQMYVGNILLQSLRAQQQICGAHSERNSEINGALPGAQTLNLRSNSTQLSVKIVEFSYLN